MPQLDLLVTSANLALITGWLITTKTCSFLLRVSVHLHFLQFKKAVVFIKVLSILNPCFK